MQDIASVDSKEGSGKEQLGKSYAVPQVEIVIISDIMNVFFLTARGTDTKGSHTLLHKMSSLLQDLLNVVLSRKQHFTSNEATWTETDLEQVLQESANDLELMREASTLEGDASFQINDMLKYGDYMCEQFEERCRKTEEDMNFCLEKFNGLVFFGEGICFIQFF